MLGLELVYPFSEPVLRLGCIEKSFRLREGLKLFLSQAEEELDILAMAEIWKLLAGKEPAQEMMDLVIERPEQDALSYIFYMVIIMRDRDGQAGDDALHHGLAQGIGDDERIILLHWCIGADVLPDTALNLSDETDLAELVEIRFLGASVANHDLDRVEEI